MKKFVSMILIVAFMMAMFAPCAMAAKKTVNPCASYRYGDRGTAVTTIHKRLKAWGYGTTTGNRYTDSTVFWVETFQRANGLAVTGIVDSLTLTKLKAKKGVVTMKSYALSNGWLLPGTTGVDVIYLQMRLKMMGFYCGKFDGKYGNGLKTSVKKYQRSKYVIDTGYVTPDMMLVLKSQVPKASLMKRGSTMIEGIIIECKSRLGKKAQKTGAAWVSAMFKTAKLVVPTTGKALSKCKYCEHIYKFSECQRGDILLFADRGCPYKYIGIYLGHKKVVIVNWKTKIVEIVDISSESEYINCKKFTEALRFLPTDGGCCD